MRAAHITNERIAHSSSNDKEEKEERGKSPRQARRLLYFCFVQKRAVVCIYLYKRCRENLAAFGNWNTTSEWR